MNLTLSNLAVWCLQIAVIVAAAGTLPLLVRLVAPKARLVYWHCVLVTCIALPFVQPWQRQAVITTSNITISTGPARIVENAPSGFSLWSAPEIAIGLLTAGAALRLLWLGIGLLRLRRYRRAAEQVLPLPDDARAQMRRLGVHADLYISEDVSSPVTFGTRSPVILLPVSFIDLPPEKRDPIICHELLHVQRSDWLFAIAEETVRAVLWFHPAIWWLLGRIHLTREQVVDQAVIEHTQAPDHYVDALIAIASTRLEADLAPAPLFLRKRHLRQRVSTIVKGVRMSKRRLLLTSFAVFSALPLVVGITAWQFPLNAAPQEVHDGPGVEVVGGPFKVLHRAPILYPADAASKGISGGVVLSVSVNAKGEVTDAKVVSGTPELRRAALASVLNWHFATEPWQVGANDTRPMPSSFEVAIRFTAPKVQRLPSPPTPAGQDTKGYPVDRIDLSQLPKALQDRIASANLVREAEFLTQHRIREISAGLIEIDEHLKLSAHFANEKVTLKMFLLDRANSVHGGAYTFSGPPASDLARATAADSSTSPQRIRVGGFVAAANLEKKVTPLYPPLAKQARIQGVVSYSVVIGKDGSIVSMQLMSGHPMLVPAATEALQQWTYKPTLLNGNPVEVITQVDINFTLSE